MHARDALDLTLASLRPLSLVLDIGSGEGEHAAELALAEHLVCKVDYRDGLRYQDMPIRPAYWDAVWCSHVLEHQVDPGDFLRRIRRELKPGGLFAVTVPPLKNEIVGGHVTLWNAGLLLYQLVLAGFDCRAAAVKSYGYNVSVLVRRVDAELPRLRMDGGDIDALAPFFPFPVSEGFDGRILQHNWRPV